MDMHWVCEYCGEARAVTSCDVCGSRICSDCKLEYGCKVCNGGEKSFE